MDASQPSDETLLARHREGDEAAFAELVHRYEQELFGFLLRYVRRPAVAEDLFQETFLQVHQSADSFDPSRKLRPWLFTIAANKARDHLRRMRRRQTRPLSAPFGAGEEGDGAGYLDLLEADLPLPSEGVENAETAELVRQVVSELPDHLREILLLAYFQKFSYKEISSMLEVPLGTVKSRLHAAVGTFAELWRHRYGEQQPAS